MIPGWLPEGVLPPTLSPTGELRAPYQTSTIELVRRFRGTAERRAILDGLLRLREQIRTLGLDEGFQWVDGSFCENVEATAGRPPKDVDVVTFARLGDAQAQQRLLGKAPQFFDRAKVQATYQVDHYWVDLAGDADADLVRRVSYWYSMWSHRRDGLWKGFLQLELTEDDTAAIAELAKSGPKGNE